ncbi:MAG: hypothetical protein JWO15_109 [Sphingomonadales bacterium]|nr:hypothetical protein [Sphingomonadales bacterium]
MIYQIDDGKRVIIFRQVPAPIADIAVDAMINGMTRNALISCGLSFIGLIVAYGIAVVATRVPEVAHSYWAGVGAVGAIVLVYYVAVHPRLEAFHGYEYAALLVGGVGGITLLGLLWLAVTGAALR